MDLRWRRTWDDPSEALPVDVLPCSNGEYIPPPPTEQQRRIMALAERETERWRRKLGMSRRQFVRTAGAMAIGFWAIDTVADRRWGNYGAAHNTQTTHACDLEWAGRGGLETLSNLPGEFIFDVQSHHIDPEGLWRVNNPAIHAFFAVVWPQSSALLGDQPSIGDDGSIRGGGAGELDPMQNLSRFHYLKELFLDSATTMTVLSAVPSAPDTKQPLPIAEAAETVETVNRLAGSQRSVMHAFVMPNRGSAGTNTEGYGLQPVFLQEELELMSERAQLYGSFLRGWKVYCPWGDVPNASGWLLDSDDIGKPFLQHIVDVSRQYGVPPVLATHKGFALPGFDQRAAATNDVGPAAKAFPEVKFIVYHSGHDTGADYSTPYAGADAYAPGDRNVYAFVANLQRSGTDALSHSGRSGSEGGNTANIYAELGSVWRDTMGSPSESAHLLGTLINHVGAKRVVWGTDSLWYGSPQREIVALRRFEFSDEAKAFYNLPHGLEGDANNPQQPAPTPAHTIRNAILGRNAAEAYQIDPDATRHALACDEVEKLHQHYVENPGSERETATLASNTLTGPRTRRELFTMLKEKPWSP